MIAIDQWGTFDVANYGDLLFPLVFERELGRRLPSLHLTISSPKGGPFSPEPSRSVRRIARFDEPLFYDQALAQHAVVLGGGDLVRLDQHSMDRIYGTTQAEAEASRVYSLFVNDLGRLAACTPVFWNAVGVPYDFRAAERDQVRRALSHIRLITVRDEISKRRLEATGTTREITVVPDTAFLSPRLFSRQELFEALARFGNLGLLPASGDYLLFHASAAFQASEDVIAECLRAIAESHPHLPIVILPIGICHDDLPTLRRLHERLAGRATLIDGETSLLEVTAVIANARFLISSSLHGNITAYAHGVDHVVLDFLPSTPSKLAGYAALTGRADCLVGTENQLLARMHELIGGRHSVAPGAYPSIARKIDAHFDQLAEALAACSADRAGVDEREMQLRGLVVEHQRVLSELTLRSAHAYVAARAIPEPSPYRESELWALLLDAYDRVARLTELLSDGRAHETDLERVLNERTAWAHSLLSEAEARGDVITELDQALVERTAWAERMVVEAEARGAVIRELKAARDMIDQNEAHQR